MYQLHYRVFLMLEMIFKILILFNWFCFILAEQLTVCQSYKSQQESFTHFTKECRGQTLLLQQKGFKGDEGEPGRNGSQGIKGQKGGQGEPANQTKVEEFQNRIEGVLTKFVVKHCQ